MRYICTLENQTIIIKDIIDNEVYNIKDLDINELDYIMGKGFSDEVFAIQDSLNGKSEFGNRYIERTKEIITATDKEGIINTSPILKVSHIGVKTDTIIVNNRVRCGLCMVYEVKPSSTIKLKIKKGIDYLRLSLELYNNRYTKVDFIISEKDLLKVGEVAISSSRRNVTLSVEELNRDISLKEFIPTRITRLKVKCERFSMLNLLNVPNVQTYILCTNPYNIGEWLSQTCSEGKEYKKGMEIRIEENGTLLNWFFNLENYETELNDNIFEKATVEIAFDYDGCSTEELDFVKGILSHGSVPYIKTYQDLVLKLSMSSFFRSATIKVLKKENIK